MSATVHQAFRDSAARHGAQPFLCILPETAEAYGIAAGELAYGAAAEAIETLRAAYARAGYGHGHRAGLLLENRPAFFLHWFALNALGVSVVPINPDLRAAELEYLTGHLKSRWPWPCPAAMPSCWPPPRAPAANCA